jgi:hypothetical protein
VAERQDFQRLRLRREAGRDQPENGNRFRGRRRRFVFDKTIVPKETKLRPLPESRRVLLTISVMLTPLLAGAND